VDDLVPGQRDLADRVRGVGVLKRGDDREDGSGEHDEGDPPVPGCPAADLVLVQAGQALADLEVLLDGPAEPVIARSIIRRASCGFVANAVSRGIPAAAQRAGPAVYDFGRYSSRSISAPGRGGIPKVDRDLRVLDPPGRPGEAPRLPVQRLDHPLREVNAHPSLLEVRPPGGRHVQLGRDILAVVEGSRIRV
jgi:hypothetical protein